jgi:hypothetical protein
MRPLDKEIKKLLHAGTVIPAHPLALNADRILDEERQRRLTAYYMASGAGGVAVGVHTTQFEIRKPEIALLEPVLKLAADEIRQADLKRPFIKVAGIVGSEKQALGEAELAVKHDYDLGLLSMGGLTDLTENEIIKRAYKVSEIIPLFGFYLQPAVGGRLFSYEFWHDFAQIPGLEAIKVAAFNRYQTLDVVRAVCHSPRREEIVLYTGNDDNIVADLLTPYRFEINGERVEKRFVGGLLGHWAVWTHAAVQLLERVKQCDMNDKKGISDLLAEGIAVTDLIRKTATMDVSRGSMRSCADKVFLKAAGA